MYEIVHLIRLLFCWQRGDNLRIAICEDDMGEMKKFVDALHGWDPTRQVECFTDGNSFLEAAKGIESFSIVFLDIYLPGENGMDIARELQKISPETGIVFVTTSTEHAVDAFSLHALHYLVKPITTEGIVEAFRRLTLLTTRWRPMLRLTVGWESHNIYLDEIYYLQSVNHAIEVHLTNGRLLKVWTTLGELEQKISLKKKRFSVIFRREPIMFTVMHG